MSDINNYATPAERENDSDLAPYFSDSLPRDLAGLPSGPTLGYPDCEPDINPLIEPVQPVSDPGREPDKEMTRRSGVIAHESVPSPVIEPDNVTESDKWAPFSEKQGKVLIYLTEAGGIANREKISLATGVNIATVKYALRVLTNDGYIGNIQVYVYHKIRGFTYTMNAQLCNAYASRVRNPDRLPYREPVRTPANWPAYEPVKAARSESVNPVAAPLVVDFDQNLTTTKGKTTDYESILGALAEDPELEWWRSKGLEAKQVETWMEAAKCSVASILQSLRHFAFEMEDGRESKLTNPYGYFFSVVRKAGSYKAPAGYRSHAKKVADFEEELLQAERAEINRLVEIRRNREEAALELEFEQILSDSECPAYQELLSGLTEFEKRQSERLLTVSLRRVFQERNKAEGKKHFEAEEGSKSGR